MFALFLLYFVLFNQFFKTCAKTNLNVSSSFVFSSALYAPVMRQCIYFNWDLIVPLGNQCVCCDQLQCNNDFVLCLWLSIMACTKSRNTGTLEHRNTPEHPGTLRNTPEHHGTPRNTTEHPETPPEHPGTPRNTPEHPGTPPEHWNLTVFPHGLVNLLVTSKHAVNV